MKNKIKKAITIFNLIFGIFGLSLVIFFNAGLDIFAVSWINFYVGYNNLDSLKVN